MGGSKKWIGFALLKKKKRAIKAARPAPRNIKAVYHCPTLVQGSGYFFLLQVIFFVVVVLGFSAKTRDAIPFMLIPGALAPVLHWAAFTRLRCQEVAHARRTTTSHARGHARIRQHPGKWLA